MQHGSQACSLHVDLEKEAVPECHPHTGGAGKPSLGMETMSEDLFSCLQRASVTATATLKLLFCEDGHPVCISDEETEGQGAKGKILGHTQEPSSSVAYDFAQCWQMYTGLWLYTARCTGMESVYVFTVCTHWCTLHTHSFYISTGSSPCPELHRKLVEWCSH